MTLEEHIKRYDSRAKSIRTAIVEKKESQEIVELLRELKDYREREFCRYCREHDTLIFDEPCKSCKIRFVRREINAGDN